MPTKLTEEMITAAILGFEEQKRRIDSRIGELKAVLSGAPAAEPESVPETIKPKRRKMSAAGRRAIAEAQRKRWAEVRKPAEPVASKAAAKPKRKLSAAGRAAIIAATKKRWALKRAADAKAERAAKRSTPAKTAQKRVPAKKAAFKKAAAKKAPAASPAAIEPSAQ
jgi:hypothetical protein